MTEKQYKLERWTDTSLYYSFPNGSVHQSIGYIIEKVEKDLNKLAEENEQLKQQLIDVDKLIDDKIKEYQNMMNMILKNIISEQLLKELKKELKDDTE